MNKIDVFRLGIAYRRGSFGKEPGVLYQALAYHVNLAPLMKLYRQIRNQKRMNYIHDDFHKRFLEVYSVSGRSLGAIYMEPVRSIVPLLELSKDCLPGGY